MSNRVPPPVSPARQVEHLAFRAMRQILELRAQVAAAEATLRELLVMTAAIDAPLATPGVAAAAAQPGPQPPTSPVAFTAQPSARASRAAVDTNEAAVVKTKRLVTERTTPPKTTRPPAKRNVRELDLEAANDELLCVPRRAW